MTNGKGWIWPSAGVEDDCCVERGENDCQNLTARRFGSGLWAKIGVETSFKSWTSMTRKFFIITCLEKDDAWHVKKVGKNTAVTKYVLIKQRDAATRDVGTKILCVPSSVYHKNNCLPLKCFWCLRRGLSATEMFLKYQERIVWHWNVSYVYEEDCLPPKYFLSIRRGLSDTEMFLMFKKKIVCHWNIF